jgi:hypothetical protein
LKAKWFVGIIMVAAAMIGGGAAYAWNRLTAVPPWYASTTPLASPNLSLNELINTKLAADTDGDDRLEVTLTVTEVNQIVNAAATQDPRLAPVLATGQGVQTTISRDRIESGTLINLSQIPRDSLPPGGTQALDQLTQTFPMLANNEVYIGLSGTPTIVDGRLNFGEDASVRIGRLTFPLNEVASRLGMSQGQLENQLSTILLQQGVPIDSLEVVNGEIVLSGNQPN